MRSSVSWRARKHCPLNAIVSPYGVAEIVASENVAFAELL